MTVSPWATKARLHRAEARIADLEAQVSGLLACLDRLNPEVGLAASTVVRLKHHVEARDAAADFIPGPSPGPPAWH